MQINPDLVEESIAAGLVDTEQELLEAIRLSAIVTHEWGNRRYEHLVFQVEKGEVTDVQLFANHV